MDMLTASKRAQIRSVAVPNEHGGWGFLLEPIVLGLLLGASWPGICISVAAASIFLMRHPLKLALTDRRRNRRFGRTVRAEQFVLLYGTVAAIALALAILLSRIELLIPAVVAAPFAAVMLIHDSRGESRRWLPELAGPIALSASAPMITLAVGWPVLPSLGLMALLALRAVPAILYVRVRIRLARQEPVSKAVPLWAHGIALALGTGLAATGHWPALTVLALAILLGRALYGLTIQKQLIPAKIIGFQEIAFGLMFVVLTALGFQAGN
jgi:hypothetical protein